MRQMSRYLHNKLNRLDIRTMYTAMLSMHTRGEHLCSLSLSTQLFVFEQFCLTTRHEMKPNTNDTK